MYTEAVKRPNQNKDTNNYKTIKQLLQIFKSSLHRFVVDLEFYLYKMNYVKIFDDKAQT